MVNKILRSNINTIVRGFVDGRRKYARQVLATNVISFNSHMGERVETKVNITFFERDAIKVNTHDNDPLVIIVQHGNWDVKRVLVDLGSSVGVLFWDVF